MDLPGWQVTIPLLSLILNRRLTAPDSAAAGLYWLISWLIITSQCSKPLIYLMDMLYTVA
jgi:hypothetical protein